jgi:hypothetical protein
MVRPDPLVASQVNWAQYEAGQTDGHYESFYLRANHPERPLAFWLRYTIFAPAGRPGDALGELWAVWFDGEAGRHTVAKVEVPLSECRFATDAFDVRVAGAELDATHLRGQCGDIGWDLDYTGGDPPLYLLPARLYRGGFPKAKSLVSLPLAQFTGTVTVAGQAVAIDDWVGSQNHNWGSRHTDRYAFGQVAGFRRLARQLPRSGHRPQPDRSTMDTIDHPGGAAPRRPGVRVDRPCHRDARQGHGQPA